MSTRRWVQWHTNCISRLNLLNKRETSWDSDAPPPRGVLMRNKCSSFYGPDDYSVFIKKIAMQSPPPPPLVYPPDSLSLSKSPESFSLKFTQTINHPRRPQQLIDCDSDDRRQICHLIATFSMVIRSWEGSYNCRTILPIIATQWSYKFR